LCPRLHAPGHALSRPTTMDLRIKICRDVWGTWSVDGASFPTVSNLPSLSASIDYARQACNAAPATIELYVDGMYIVAHQERGWPDTRATPPKNSPIPSRTHRAGNPTPTAPDAIKNTASPRSPPRMMRSFGTVKRGRNS